MKPNLFKMNIRRHPLIAAGSVEMAVANAGGCLTADRTIEGSDPWPGWRAESKKNTLLLVSNDASLGVRVSDAACLAELPFQQFNDAANALRLAERDRAAAVLLDLDLPASSGWVAAELFLRDENGPPVALMSARLGHLDLGLAIRSGLVMDKSIGSSLLLEQVHALLAKSHGDRQLRRACQQLLIRWLRPYESTVPVSPDHRHWGINE